jgi:hypothetical protein
VHTGGVCGSHRRDSRGCPAVARKGCALQGRAGGEVCPSAVRANLSALLKVEEALGRFVRVEGVEPTHHAAERARQSAVIWRRTRLRTQSTEGSPFVARMLTVVLTLRAPQRNGLAYLTTACKAARRGLPAPSLLPDRSLLEPEHHLAIAA